MRLRKWDNINDHFQTTSSVKKLVSLTGYMLFFPPYKKFQFHASSTVIFFAAAAIVWLDCVQPSTSRQSELLSHWIWTRIGTFFQRGHQRTTQWLISVVHYSYVCHVSWSLPVSGLIIIKFSWSLVIVHCHTFVPSQWHGKCREGPTR